MRKLTYNERSRFYILKDESLTLHKKEHMALLASIVNEINMLVFARPPIKDLHKDLNEILNLLSTCNHLYLRNNGEMYSSDEQYEVYIMNRPFQVTFETAVMLNWIDSVWQKAGIYQFIPSELGAMA